MNLVATFDGAHSGKHGLAAAGAVLWTPEGEEIATDARALVGVTVPVAEHTALQVALGLAARHAGSEIGSSSIKLYGDAELIVRQIDGRYRCHREDMAALRDLTHMMMALWGSSEVLELEKTGENQKRRNLNVRADAVAGDCLKDAIARKLEMTTKREEVTANG